MRTRNYSIADVPLSSLDTELLSEAVGILKQLSGFSALSGTEDIRGHGRYTTFQLEVIVNPELERDLLAYGCGITVLSPQSLVESIRRHHKASVTMYK